MFPPTQVTNGRKSAETLLNSAGRDQTASHATVSKLAEGAK